jgi:hypothetical protein
MHCKMRISVSRIASGKGALDFAKQRGVAVMFLREFLQPFPVFPATSKSQSACIACICYIDIDRSTDTCYSCRCRYRYDARRITHKTQSTQHTAVATLSISSAQPSSRRPSTWRYRQHSEFTAGYMTPHIKRVLGCWT